MGREEREKVRTAIRRQRGSRQFPIMLCGSASLREPVALAERSHYNQGMSISPEPARPTEQGRAEPSDAIREAIESGIDISMLRANLALSTTASCIFTSLVLQ
jgi:hypothetical protein